VKVSGELHDLAALTRDNRIGGYVGLRVGLDTVKKRIIFTSLGNRTLVYWSAIP
jgi:hypothetical protein